MQYLFDEPFIVDSSKIADRLGARATPIDHALTTTLATYTVSHHHVVVGRP